MKCLLFTVFTLVLICALFKGTESAERREIPSIRYFATFEGGRDPRRVWETLSPPWGNWFLAVNVDVPTFVTEPPAIAEEWRPIAQLKLIGDEMRVIQMYGTFPENSLGRDPYNLTRPGYRWRRGYHRLPSSGSGLLLVPDPILNQPTEVGAYYDVRPLEEDRRTKIDLVTFQVTRFSKCTISIEVATPMPLDCRSSIPVYTTIVVQNPERVLIYQVEAGQTLNMMNHYPGDLLDGRSTSRIGSIAIIHPDDCEINDSAPDRMTVSRSWDGGDWVQLWISKSQTPLILESAILRKMFFKNYKDLSAAQGG